MPRKKSSVIEDLFDITSRLPWWVGVSLALIASIVLHQYANSNVDQTVLQGRPVANPFSTMTHMLAKIGQYVLPIIFLTGALFSVLNAKRKSALLSKQTGLDSIRQLSWREFEELVGEYYRRHGYTVTETEDGPDGGIDLVLKKDGKTTLVQCKHWKSAKVGVTVVRELFGVMTSVGADHGIVVATGTFSAEADRFAEQNGIELISGNHLISLIGSVQKKKRAAVSPIESPEAVECPVCGSLMTLRVAKRGPQAGKKFWGCRGFPKCRGTRPYP